MQLEPLTLRRRWGDVETAVTPPNKARNLLQVRSRGTTEGSSSCLLQFFAAIPTSLSWIAARWLPSLARNFLFRHAFGADFTPTLRLTLTLAPQKGAASQMKTSKTLISRGMTCVFGLGGWSRTVSADLGPTTLGRWRSEPSTSCWSVNKR